MGQTFDGAERETIRKAIEAARAAGKFSQRGTAKVLALKLPGRSFGSVYAEVRRLTTSGQWWSDKPVGHQLI